MCCIPITRRARRSNKKRQSWTATSTPTSINIRRSFVSRPRKIRQIEWLGGVFLFYDDIMSYNQQQYGPNSTQWYAASGTPAALLNPMLLNGVNYNLSGKQRDFTIAGYGQATYHFDEKLALTLGLRNSYEVKEGSNVGWIGDYGTRVHAAAGHAGRRRRQRQCRLFRHRRPKQVAQHVDRSVQPLV